MLIALRFDGPVLSAGLGSSTFGLDAEMRRDARGQQVLPAAHIRGRLREALIEIVATATGDPDGAESIATHLFGRAQGSDARGATADHALRGLLRFHDLTRCQAPPTTDQPATPTGLEPLAISHLAAEHTLQPADSSYPRVAIDGRTGTARRAHLVSLEADRSGRTTWYAGEVEVPAGGGAGLSPTQLEHLLAWCLRWVGEVGRSGTAGWGRIQERRVGSDDWLKTDLLALLGALQAELVSADQAAPSATPPQPDRDLVDVTVAVVLHGPLVIADGKAGPNVFECRVDIPGAVLRRGLADVLCEAAGRRRGGWVDAALAATLSDPLDAQLASRFGQVQASFGLPVSQGAPAQALAPLPRPLSSWTDRSAAALHDALPDLLNGTPPPSFVKNSVLDTGGYLSVAQQQHALPLSLRTHVAKSARTGAGRAGQLYSYRAIDEVHTGQGERVRFVATFRCPADLEPALRGALARVRWLGKATSRGYGQVRLYEVARPATEPRDWWADLQKWNHAQNTTARLPLTVVTESLLLDSALVDVADSLEEAYAAAWSEALGLDARVCLVLAHHRLRASITARGRSVAPPLLLTQPGSTFVLDLPGRLDDHQDAIRRVVQRGAERPTLLANAEQSWQQMVPFTNANGYGAVVVHDMHLESKTP